MLIRNKKTPIGAGGYTEGARVYHSVDQSIPNATVTVLAFDSERYDTDDIHDTVTNNSRLTCKTAGKYLIIGQVRFYANSTGWRWVDIYLNGTTYIAAFRLDANSASDHEMVIASIYDLAVNDYVELRVVQTSGGSLSVLAPNNGISPEFMMQRIG
jgi:hypothetical protein